MLGKLGWSPSEMWSATIVEAFAAIDGFAEFHGGKPPAAPPKTKVDDMLLRFPDPPKGRRG